MHTMPIHDDLTTLVIEEVRDGSVESSMPTLKVKLVGEALGTLFLLLHSLHFSLRPLQKIIRYI